MKKLRLTSKIDDSGEMVYLDELSPDPVWIPRAKLIQYLKSEYLLTPKLYFDAVMRKRGISDFDKCSICHGDLHWLNIFSGYTGTCSTQCRNLKVSKGNPELVIVTNKFTVTHIVNQESLTRYKVPYEVQANIPENLNLMELIAFLTENHCTWISGYNDRSIRYAREFDKTHKLTLSLK